MTWIESEHPRKVFFYLRRVHVPGYLYVNVAVNLGVRVFCGSGRTVAAAGLRGPTMGRGPRCTGPREHPEGPGPGTAAP